MSDHSKTHISPVREEEEKESGTEPTHARYDPVIGSEVSGYRVTSRLGAGGMGVVYEGEQPVIGKRVAIKVLRHEVADNPDVVQRLVAEARAVNQVGHRGIIDVFGFGQLPDGRQCIVMEYLNGEPLETVLDSYQVRHATIPLVDGLTILEEILSALAAAHSAGVIHRDLKPSNIFLCQQRDGARYVKLLDFGIAKLGVLGNSTPASRASVMMGTPAYMAPEQANGGAVTPAMDLYALGVLAFELLTGRPPFVRDSVMAMLLAHAGETPPRVSELSPQVPPVLDELVARLMAKRPEDRPPSAEAVRVEIAALRASLASASATPLSLMLLPNPFDPSSPPRPSRPELPAVSASASPRATGTSAPAASATAAGVPEPVVAAGVEPARATSSRRGALVLFGAAALVAVVAGGALLFGRSSAAPEGTAGATPAARASAALPAVEAKPAGAASPATPREPAAEAKPAGEALPTKPPEPAVEAKSAAGAKPAGEPLPTKPPEPAAEARPAAPATPPEAAVDARSPMPTAPPTPVAPALDARPGAAAGQAQPARPTRTAKAASGAASVAASPAPSEGDGAAKKRALLRARVQRIEGNLTRAEKDGEDVSLFRRTMAKVKGRLEAPSLHAAELEELDVTLSRLEQETSSL